MEIHSEIHTEILHDPFESLWNDCRNPKIATFEKLQSLCEIGVRVMNPCLSGAIFEIYLVFFEMVVPIL